MSATVYIDKNYGGASHTLNVGNYSREYLRDLYYANFEKSISSLRVDRNTIILLSSNSHPTGTGDNRVFVGPINVPDLSAIGFDDRIGSISIKRFREDDWGANASATIYSMYGMTGRFKDLRAGEYNATRIAAKENNVTGIEDGEIRSLVVGDNTVVILYDGPNFDEDKDAVYIEGPSNIDDMARYGMDGKVSSIRVYSIDTPPKDLPPNTMTSKNTANATSLYNDRWKKAIELRRQIDGYKGYNEYKRPTEHTVKKDHPVIVPAKIKISWADKKTMGINNALFLIIFVIMVLVVSIVCAAASFKTQYTIT